MDSKTYLSESARTASEQFHDEIIDWIIENRKENH